MKKTIAILLIMFSMQANAFSFLNKIHSTEVYEMILNIQQQIVANEMNVTDFLKFDEIKTINEKYKLVSYDVFVLPTKNSGIDPFEFSVNTKSNSFIPSKINKNQIKYQQGTKIYFDNITVIDEKGNEINLGTIAFKLK